MVQCTVLAVWVPKPAFWMKLLSEDQKYIEEMRYCVVVNLTAALVWFAELQTESLLSFQCSEKSLLHTTGLHSHSSETFACRAEGLYCFVMPAPCLNPATLLWKFHPASALGDHFSTSQMLLPRRREAAMGEGQGCFIQVAGRNPGTHRYSNSWKVFLRSHLCPKRSLYM